MTDQMIDARFLIEWVAFKHAQQVERDAEAKLTGLLHTNTSWQALIGAMQDCGRAVERTRLARQEFYAAVLKTHAEDASDVPSRAREAFWKMVTSDERAADTASAA